MNRILDSTPRFIEENLVYKRKEENGSLVFLSRRHPETQQLQLNDTARFIAELCNGKNSVGRIVKKILEEYQGATRDRVVQDVINILHSLWRLGLIEWKKENPLISLYYTKKVDNYTFRVLTEDEAVAIVNKLKNVLHYVNPYINEETSYSELAIRQKVFAFTEVFFSLFDKGHESMVISFSGFPGTRVRSLRILYLYFDANFISTEAVRNFLRWCIKKVKQFNVFFKDISRIHAYCLSHDKLHFEQFHNIGFKHAGTLKKELGWDSPAIEVFFYDVN
ncbi:MAG: hypothetical protein PWQ27_1841 [Kosmotoga sp.]|nr:hypothetical protein [Kosmotoga sp.]